MIGAIVRLFGGGLLGLGVAVLASQLLYAWTGQPVLAVFVAAGLGVAVTSVVLGVIRIRRARGVR